ncbi:Catechol O-methyltransferase [Mycena indigotica]|uniref:catechol O-methyltransferase n=1 Tax=Mycena indigotica TaxID=2126181 RepID=A0A8H6TB24_9AGAR|nr:Catechol O-methyltransferase [Mycena indigotica]KAF7312595.1 Catechol O-methyltransferase [Mycena indigotica]
MAFNITPELLEKYPSLKSADFTGEKPFFNDGREGRLLEWIYARSDLEALRGSPARVCAAIEEFAIQKEFLISIGSTKAKIVEELIAAEKPKVMVELGGYMAYSAIFFADAMRRQHAKDTKVQYWSLEYNPLFTSIAMNLVDLAGLSDVVQIVTGTAGSSLKRLAAENKLDHIDVLFIDHLGDNYHTDFQICESLNLLKSGALIIADNTLIPGAPEYLDYVRKHPKLDTKAVKSITVPGDFEDEMEITKVK